MKLLVAALLLSTGSMLAAEPTTPAAGAINALGVDLLRQTAKPGANALLSPYSIQSALAMTYAGADGDTRTEMARALHYPEDDDAVHRSFSALRKALNDVVQKSAQQSEVMKKHGGKQEPITLTMANRLFGQTGYAFRAEYLAFVQEHYGAPLQPLDFAKNTSRATKHINDWVEDQTRKRIRDLIPDGTLNQLTRLVLVNAIYLKAPWADEFHAFATKPQPFRLGADHQITVPTMTAQRSLGYTRRDNCTVLTIPYSVHDLQFLILLPDQVDGLADLEKKLTAGLLSDCAKLESREVILHLPKFKLEPPAVRLSEALQKLGIKSAFDQPPGSANFDRIAPRRPNEYLYISEVIHKTFLNLDERGTEAAAATAVVMAAGSAAREKPEPVEAKVDHPFLFAIQHRVSGACLFLGHVADPR